jgi:DNA polymerase-3 subunit epsilon
VNETEPNLKGDFETMAAALEASGDYRVLRRLTPRSTVTAEAGDIVRQGLFVDVETTGLDPARDEIIELAMVPFTYTQSGRLLTVGEPFQAFRQPKSPIPPEITALTGIDDAMVAGATIDPSKVAAFAAAASFVVAHNAAFDRRFLERLCKVFTTKAWGCSMTQIDWGAEGYEGVKLGYLAGSAGFYDRHRAVHDCLAAIELLARTQPVSQRTALAQLLDQARAPSWRIWAENSPYDLKDILKARGYRWNGDDGVGGPRAWYIDVADVQRAAEITFLQTEIYCGEIDLLTRRVDAYKRFSDRV